jgi:hypothetical protein
MHGENNAGVRFENGNFTVEGVRIDNVTDGIRPVGGPFTIRGSWLSYVRDDCVENDWLHPGLVEDNLFDGCYVAFAARPTDGIIAEGGDGRGEVWTIRNNLIRMEAMPGPRTGPSPNYGAVFKWHNWTDPSISLSPKLALHNNIFLIDRMGAEGVNRMGLPPEQVASCSNNTLVWLGPGEYPAKLPSCFTVTKDRKVWDVAVAGWKARHPGVGG